MFLFGCGTKKLLHNNSPLIYKKSKPIFHKKNKIQQDTSKLSVHVSNCNLKSFIQSLNYINNKNITLDSKLYDVKVSLDMSSSFHKIIHYICEKYSIILIDNILKEDVITVRTHKINFIINETESSNNLQLSTIISVDDNDEKNQILMKNKSNTNFWAEFKSNLHMLVGQENYSINKQAGVVIIKCKESKHVLIKEYIETLRESLNKKILLEARIIEIDLHNNTESGVNWSKIQDQTGAIDIINNSGGTFSMKINDEFNGILTLLSEYGKTKTIANPFLSVLNNHMAVFKSAHDEVYFKIKHETRSYNNYETNEHSSTSHSVPVGIMLTAHASVENDNIILSLRPTISKVINYLQDPSVKEKSVIPVIHTKEMYTTISVKPGQVVLIGGLLEESKNKSNRGLPLLSNIPIVGSLFGRKESKMKKSELVIIIKVHVDD